MATLSGIAMVLSGCDRDRLSTADPVWTLYARTGPIARRHVATFDMDDASTGNKAECERVSLALSAQDRNARFWCELGRYRAAPPG